jgi:hypothetical protein
VCSGLPRHGSEEGKIQVADTRHDRAGRNSARPPRGPQPKMRARERIAAERAARKRAEARRRILVAVASVTAVLAVVVALVAVKLTSTPARLVASESPASAVVVRQVTTVPGATLSFRTAHYQSTELTLRTTELTDDAGRPLQAQTPLDTSLIGTFDVPPYVNSADQSGAVPFLDIANRYVLAGAQYDPQVLAGLSAAQIASQLSNPASPVARAIDGSAQVIVAAINQVLRD